MADRKKYYLSLANRLADTAQMTTQYPEWLCKELFAAATAITDLLCDLEDANHELRI